MAIIKLTDFADEETEYYINTKNIDGFYIGDESNDVTDVCTIKNSFRVKETPEEIRALIEKAEAGDFSQKSKIFSRAFREF